MLTLKIYSKLNMTFYGVFRLSPLLVKFKCYYSSRSQIKLFAYENAKSSLSIEDLQLPDFIDSAIAESWLKEFVTHRLHSKASLQAGILQIWFFIDDQLIVGMNLFSLLDY